MYSRCYNAQGKEEKSSGFSAGGNYHQLGKCGSFGMRGERVTKLGTNM